MLRALMWKDVRVNGVPLFVGLLLLLLPLTVGSALNFFGYWRYGVWGESWASLVARMGVLSLGVSLVTFGMVPGNAIAGERADRSAEFLAYLPPSRGLCLLSKAVIAVMALAAVWTANAMCAWLIAPALGEVPPDSADFVRTTFPWVSGAAVAVFGAAWLASSVSPSPVYAAGVGFAAPWLVLGALAVCEFGFGRDRWIGSGFVLANTVVGTLCFLGGIVCYLRRVRP